MQFDVQLFTERSTLVKGVEADSHNEALSAAVRRAASPHASTPALSERAISAVVTPLDSRGAPIRELVRTLEPREVGVMQEAVRMIEVMHGLTTAMQHDEHGRLLIDENNVWYQRAVQGLDRIQSLSQSQPCEQDPALSMPLGM